MNLRWFWRSAVAAVALCAVVPPALAAVELRQLTEDALDQEFPAWRDWGVEPGDVLLRNDLVRVIVFTNDANGRLGRTGACLVLSQRDPVRVTPGPAGVWGKAEFGKTNSVAVLRFKRQDANWSAELVFEAHESDPWIEVITTVRNLSKEAVVELPLVDALEPTKPMRLTGEQGSVVYLTGSSGQTSAMTSVKKVFSLGQGPHGVWTAAYLSGDPQTQAKRSGLRLFGKPTTNPPPLRPIPISEEWHKEGKSVANWFRLTPGSARQVRRRLFSANSDDEARSAVALSQQDTAPRNPLATSPPTTDQRPAVAVAGSRQTTSATHVPSTPPRKHIIGRRRDEKSSSTSLTRSSADSNRPATQVSSRTIKPATKPARSTNPPDSGRQKTVPSLPPQAPALNSRVSSVNSPAVHSMSPQRLNGTTAEPARESTPTGSPASDASAELRSGESGSSPNDSSGPSLILPD